MSGEARRSRWRSILAVSSLLFFSFSIAPLAQALAPEQQACGCVGACTCGHDSCARELAPEGPRMRSCASDDEPTVTAAPYEAPAAFALFEPNLPREPLDDDSMPPVEIDVLPETPPPRSS